MRKDRYGNTPQNIALAEKLGFHYTEHGWYDNEDVLSGIETDNTFETLKFDTDLAWMQAAIDAQKETLINELIEQIKADAANGDVTVLDELLRSIAPQKLIASLPEENWGKYSELKKEARMQVVMDNARYYMSAENDDELREMIEAIANYEGDDNCMVDDIDMVVMWQPLEDTFTVSEFVELIGL